MNSWSTEMEDLLVEWGDIAQCYKWLTMRSHQRYLRLHQIFTIPIVIFSTLSGTASFVPVQNKYTPYVVGTVSLLIGILSTLQQFLKITELKENYHTSAVLWDKYGRNIRIELSKSPDNRANSTTFMESCRMEFDHLMDMTPVICPNVIKRFQSTFMGTENSEQRKIYEELKRPDILDKIISLDTKRHHWYKIPDLKEP